ncbi:MAG: flagellar biosynthesis anti-sigma factor FlgM [Phycisphaerae bacterium]
MMNINGIQPPAAPNPPESLGKVTAPQQHLEPQGAGDVVEISTAAKLAARIHEVPEVRWDLVQKVKSEIEAGTYETPERLEIAVNRIMEDLF